MALSNETIKVKKEDCLYDILQFLKYFCLSLYYRSYRFINTCCVMQMLHSIYYCAISFLFRDKQRIQWKTHWQSPVCHAILKQKYIMFRSKSSLSWAVFSFLAATFIFLDMRSEFSSSVFDSYSMIVWYVELIACGTFVLNGISALLLYMWSILSKPMPISPMQQKLFNIDANDSGFEVIQKENQIETKSESFQFSSYRNSFECSSPSLLSQTPINYSYNSWASTSCSSFNIDTTSSSFSFHRASSPLSYSTPKSHAERLSFKQLDYSTDLDSSYERPIRNRRHLEDFLRNQEEEKQKSFSNEDAKHLLSNLTAVENSPMAVLSKNLYQRSYRFPNAESTEESSSEIYCNENVMSKLKVTDRMLTVYCERIRKWICQTILVKLVQEIEDINNTLAQIGLPEFQIGKVSLLALNQLAITKSQNLPTLSAVLPYLNLHLNQEYLVSRLKNLACGGCMGNFKWNSGSIYNNKQWCDDLPTDSALVIHILCCYFDAHLPSEPHFPEGKPFSSKYFKKAPEQPIVSRDSFYIYQSNVNPPHFKIVLPEDIYSFQKGRNNLFCSLVIFLHYIKTKECGMLGRVNLGPSGLNLLWILD